MLASYYDLAKRFPEADAHVDPEILIRAWDYAAQSDLSGLNDSSPPHPEPETLRVPAKRPRHPDDRGLHLAGRIRQSVPRNNARHTQA